MNKSILSVGAGNNQLPLIAAIQALGYKAIACDINPLAPGSKTADIFINQSTYQAQPIIAELQQRQLQPTAVLTRSTGQPVITTAEIAQALQLPGMTVQQSKIISHKQKLINMLRQTGVPCPASYSLADDVPLPVFVKPANTIKSHAAMGKCSTRDELLERYQQAKAVSDDNSVNIEEYLHGYDIVSIDFVSHGKVIHLCTVGEISAGAPAFDGLGWYSVPTDWDRLASATFCQMQQALSLSHGFFQTAMKFNSQTRQAKIYEVHGEIGGDCVNDVYIPLHLNGYDVFANNIRLALGLPPELPQAPTRPCILIFQNKVQQYQLPITTPVTATPYQHHQCLLYTFQSDADMQKALGHFQGTNFSISGD
ncbi:ATP-grasp domain-containing protein [Shewanella sp.]|uniref:ATP-grasp domain-containing protein n=1 Tax=Shewanella sp. TaxID=50422 RepID=UPI003A9736A5